MVWDTTDRSVWNQSEAYPLDADIANAAPSGR